MCHVSCVPCHVSCVNCHMSQVFWFLFILIEWKEKNRQSGRASWWRVCFQRGIPYLTVHSSTDCTLKHILYFTVYWNVNCYCKSFHTKTTKWLAYFSWNTSLFYNVYTLYCTMYYTLKFALYFILTLYCTVHKTVLYNIFGSLHIPVLRAVYSVFNKNLNTVKRGLKMDFFNTRMCFSKFWEQQKKFTFWG